MRKYIRTEKSKKYFYGLRRILALLITASMILTHINMNTTMAFAEAVEQKYMIGADVTAILGEDGLLTISGSGETYNYSAETPSPLYEVRNHIREIVFATDSAVTELGDYLFYNCAQLSGELVLPGSIRRIGDRAFGGDNLESAPRFTHIKNEFVSAEIEVIVPAAEQITEKENAPYTVSTSDIGGVTVSSSDIEVGPNTVSASDIMSADITEMPADDAEVVVSTKMETLWEQEIGFEVFYPGQSGVFQVSGKENLNFIEVVEAAGYQSVTGYATVLLCDGLGKEERLQLPKTESGVFLPDFEETGLEYPHEAMLDYAFSCWLSEEGTQYTPYSFAQNETVRLTAQWNVSYRELTEQTITARVGEQLVTIRGNLPKGAEVSAEQAELTEEMMTLLSEVTGETEPVISFALDISILVEGVKYQPSEYGESVAVTVSNLDTIDDNMSIIHIEEGTDDATAAEVVETFTPDSVTPDGVEFTADRFSVYVGTLGSGSNLTFADGVGYQILDANGTPMNSGIFPAGQNLIFQVVTDTYHVINTITMYNETDGVKVNFTQDANGRFTIPADEMIKGRQIHVDIDCYVRAYGGQITASTSAAQVANMFDASYSETSVTEDVVVTDNVTVKKVGAEFTVTLTGDILLDGSGRGYYEVSRKHPQLNLQTEKFQAGFYVMENCILKVLSAGDHTIKRDNPDVFVGYLFKGEAGSTITLGEGALTKDVIVYHYSDGKTITKTISGTIDDPTDQERAAAGVAASAYITNAVSSPQVINNMKGTLTIDGGTPLNEYAYGGSTGTNTTWFFRTLPEDINYRNNLSLINTSSGTVNMWPGVILQNNKGYHEDTGLNDLVSMPPGEAKYRDAYNFHGGSAINVNGDNATLNMYGGLICDMVNNAPSSDSAAIGVCDGDGNKVYLFGGEITRCEARHSPGIEYWTVDKGGLYIFDTYIHHNLSVAKDPDSKNFPGSTIGTYDSAGHVDVKMFGGTIANNQNLVGPTEAKDRQADICLYSSAQATLHMYGGNVGTVSRAGNNQVGHLYIYSAAIDQVYWENEDGQLDSNLHYPGQGQVPLYSVVVPDSVASDGQVPVTIKAVNEDGSIVSSITTGGTTMSRNVTLQLPNGNYTITVSSPAMEKTYKATVRSKDTQAAATDRNMTELVFNSKTFTSVTVGWAGVDNVTADGRMYYGVALENAANDPVVGVKQWYYIENGQIYLENGTLYTGRDVSINTAQRTITFHDIHGPRYYFVRAGEAKDAFTQDTANGLLVLIVSPTTVAITPEFQTSGADSTVTYSAIVTYSDWTKDDRVVWEISGGTSPDTVITESGVLHIAANEVEQPVLQVSAKAVEGAAALTFSDGVYTVPQEGLPQGYYSITIGSSVYYFHTTAALLAGDTLTWNSTNSTVVQSKNRIFITAKAEENGEVYATAEWYLVEKPCVDVAEVEIHLNGEPAEKIIAFDENGGFSNEYAYQYDAQVVLSGTKPGDQVNLHVVPYALMSSAHLLKAYPYTSENVFGTPLTDLENGFKVGENDRGVYAYFEVVGIDGHKAIYRLHISYEQQKNYWTTELICPAAAAVPEAVETPLKPIAEARYGEVQFEFYPGGQDIEEIKEQIKAGTLEAIDSPKDVGLYVVKAYVTETSAYGGLEAYTSTEILDSMPHSWYFEGLDTGMLTYGESLSKLTFNNTNRIEEEIHWNYQTAKPVNEAAYAGNGWSLVQENGTSRYTYDGLATTGHGFLEKKTMYYVQLGDEYATYFYTFMLSEDMAVGDQLEIVWSGNKDLNSFSITHHRYEERGYPNAKAYAVDTLEWKEYYANDVTVSSTYAGDGWNSVTVDDGTVFTYYPYLADDWLNAHGALKTGVLYHVFLNKEVNGNLVSYVYRFSLPHDMKQGDYLQIHQRNNGNHTFEMYTSVEGTFSWPGNGDVKPEVRNGIGGSDELFYTIQFTPADGTRESVWSASAKVHMKRADLEVIKRYTPSAKYDGLTPSIDSNIMQLPINGNEGDMSNPGKGVVLNTVDNTRVPGVWVWSSNNLTIQDELGTRVNAHFIPDDRDNYNAPVYPIPLQISIMVTAKDQWSFTGGLAADNEVVISNPINPDKPAGLISGHKVDVVCSGQQDSVGSSAKRIENVIVVDAAGSSVDTDGDGVPMYAIATANGKLHVFPSYIDDVIEYNNLIPKEYAVSIPANSAFTTRFCFTFPTGIEFDDLAVDFGRKLPSGSSVILMDINDVNSPAFYYYNCNKDVESINLCDFKKMGTETVFAGLNGAQEEAKNLQFIVKLPVENGDTGEFKPIVHLSSDTNTTGERLISAATVAAVTTTGMLAWSDANQPVGGKGKITASVTVSETERSDNVLAVRLVDQKGNAVDLPTGTQISITDKVGNTVVRPIEGLTREDGAYRSSFASVGHIAAGEYVISITGLPEGSYRLRIDLCASASPYDTDYTDEVNYLMIPGHPMQKQQGFIVSDGVVKVERAAAAIRAVLDSENSSGVTEYGRLVTQGTAAELKFEVQTLGAGDQIICEPYEKDKTSGKYSTTSLIQVKEEDRSWTITVPDNIPIGTYRILFSYGEVSFPYNIIVKGSDTK